MVLLVVTVCVAPALADEDTRVDGVDKVDDNGNGNELMVLE